MSNDWGFQNDHILEGAMLPLIIKLVVESALDVGIHVDMLYTSRRAYCIGKTSVQ